jgi:hypothetical protein
MIPTATQVTNVPAPGASTALCPTGSAYVTDGAYRQLTPPLEPPSFQSLVNEATKGRTLMGKAARKMARE